MSTFAAIYDFEGQLEAAFKEFLEDAELTASDPDDVAFQKVRPRVEVVFQVGPATDQNLYRTFDNIFRHQIYTGTLGLRVITNARTDSETANHKTYRAKVRNQMQKARQSIEMTNLKLLYLTPQASTPSIKPEDGVEESELQFSVTFGILPAAWPATEEEA